MRENIIVSPSVMCADLVNLEKDINKLEKLGYDTLHIDVIDSSFSPSMPLGIETIKRLREITKMKFDVHIMSIDNEFFINEMIKIGVEKITFHLETSLHIDRYINLIKESNTKVGVALNPSSSLNNLEFILPQVDSVLLMLINPGFAGNKNEKQVDYSIKKIKKLNQLLKDENLNLNIQVDGRVSLETIPELIAAGANDLVVGSTGLFIPNQSLDLSSKILNEKIEEGLELRNEHIQ